MNLEPIRTGKLELLGATARCPVCGESPKGDVWVCPACSALHHAECKTYAGGCSTFGCDFARKEPIALEGKKLPAPVPGSAVTLRAAAISLALATLFLVSHLVSDSARERAEAASLQREAQRSAAVNASSSELGDLLGNIKVTIDLSGDTASVSAKLGNDTGVVVAPVKVITIP